MSSSEQEFRYRISRFTLVGWLLFLGAGAARFGYLAATNTDGLKLNQIPLTPFDATVFYSIVTAVALIGIFIAFWLLLCPERIVIGTDALRFPRAWWSRQELSIPYQSIRGVRLGRSAITGADMIHIFHTGGTARVSSAMFISDAHYRDFRKSLRDKLSDLQLPGVEQLAQVL